MAGRPVFVGAVQLTSRLVVSSPCVADTEGAVRRQRSLVHWSITFSVTAIVSEPLLPSSTLTVTE